MTVTKNMLAKVFINFSRVIALIYRLNKLKANTFYCLLWSSCHIFTENRISSHCCHNYFKLSALRKKIVNEHERERPRTQCQMKRKSPFRFNKQSAGSRKNGCDLRSTGGDTRIHKTAAEYSKRNLAKAIEKLKKQKHKNWCV